MQVSASLAEFMQKLDEGPRGVEDAIAAIEECQRVQGSILDLQQMMLTDEDMQQLASKFGSIAAHVKTLNLFMNELTVLPASIATLSNIQVLEAGCNPLESVEADLLRGLPNLIEIDIGFSETLEQLPDAFDNSRSLKIIHAGNGKLNDLPPSLFQCEKITELHLYGNSIKSISKSVGNLRSLRLLNVGRNQISQLPSRLAECSLLEVLHAYENCLSSLPAGLAKLECLKTLNVASNSNMPAPPREVRHKEGVRAIAEFYSTPLQSVNSFEVPIHTP